MKPIFDAHCDLLSYLTRPNTDPYNVIDIGCAIPLLKAGNVKLQVMAIFAPTESLSHQFGISQSNIFKDLHENNQDLYGFEKQNLEQVISNDHISMIASIESAAAFCDEHIPLKQGLQNLEKIIHNVGNLFYISFTHHTENRFGGGNYATAGLKKDGEALVEYLDNKKIAIDLSHTSDALAYDILNFRSKHRVTVPIIASHSNYRHIFDHVRNLPNEIAQEIIKENGLIGLNLLRAFMHNEDPAVFLDHIAHGLKLGGQNSICYGVDYFYHKTHPDKSRIPFFHKEHEDARSYQNINRQIEDEFGDKMCDKISYKNLLRFLNDMWQ